MLTQPLTSRVHVCVCVWGKRGGRESGVGEYLAYRLLLTAVSRWQDWFVGMDIHTYFADIQFAVWPMIKLFSTVHNYIHSRNAQAYYCILLCSCVQ